MIDFLISVVVGSIIGTVLGIIALGFSLAFHNLIKRRKSDRNENHRS